jgi:hypothetical protein
VRGPLEPPYLPDDAATRATPSNSRARTVVENSGVLSRRVATESVGPTTFTRGNAEMRTVKYWLLAALAVSLVGVSVAEEKKDDKKPLEIKASMKKFHLAPAKGEDPLCKKFVSGKTSDAETKDILAFYEDLTKAKPPIGTADSWKAKTTALYTAAKDVAAKKDGADDAFKKAITCKACHDDHRPPPPAKGDK